MTVRRLDVNDCLQSCGLTSKGLSLCLFELDYIGYEGERSGLKHWTDMPQATRDESCGHIRKWTSVLWARVQLHRMWGRKTEAKNDFTVWSHSAFIEFQIIHTVNDFSQSLLDILESRVMKRMSINHCVEVVADYYRNENQEIPTKNALTIAFVSAFFIWLQSKKTIYGHVKCTLKVRQKI